MEKVGVRRFLLRRNYMRPNFNRACDIYYGSSVNYIYIYIYISGSKLVLPYWIDPLSEMADKQNKQGLYLSYNLPSQLLTCLIAGFSQ